MEPHEKKEFNRIVNLLKKEFPAKYPIRVRTKSLKRYHGLTGFYDGEDPYFLITIGKDRFDVMVYNLIHEFGHVQSWHYTFNISENPNFHSEVWGKAFSRIYDFVWKRCLSQ